MPAPGGKASFKSEVTLTGETSFTETGTIRFGDSNQSLRFSTVGQGFLGKSPDAALQHGSVMWRVGGGGSEIAGAGRLTPSHSTPRPTGARAGHPPWLIFWWVGCIRQPFL